MTDYFWPQHLVPSASSWSLVANTAAFTSPLSGTTRTLRREVSALPVGVKADIKTLHTTLIAALRAAGVLPAGTDTADL